jgi:hypothetical protein
MSDIDDCVSDHFPIETIISVSLYAMNETTHGAQHTTVYPRIDWSDSSVCGKYSATVQHMTKDLTDVDLTTINNSDTALGYVNTMCDNIKSVIHESSLAVGEARRAAYKGKHRRKHW